MGSFRESRAQAAGRGRKPMPQVLHVRGGRSTEKSTYYSVCPGEPTEMAMRLITVEMGCGLRCYDGGVGGSLWGGNRLDFESCSWAEPGQGRQSLGPRNGSIKRRPRARARYLAGTLSPAPQADRGPACHRPPPGQMYLACTGLPGTTLDRGHLLSNLARASFSQAEPPGTRTVSPHSGQPSMTSLNRDKLSAKIAKVSLNA
jgi:hypothetical protein